MPAKKGDYLIKQKTGRYRTAAENAAVFYIMSHLLPGKHAEQHQKTSGTMHTLKGGEIYVIGLKLMAVTGEIDLYSVDDSDGEIIIEARNNATFRMAPINYLMPGIRCRNEACHYHLLHTRQKKTI